MLDSLTAELQVVGAPAKRRRTDSNAAESSTASERLKLAASQQLHCTARSQLYSELPGSNACVVVAVLDNQ